MASSVLFVPGHTGYLKSLVIPCELKYCFFLCLKGMVSLAKESYFQVLGGGHQGK